MKQNHDLEDLFSVLEHADEETLLHIAEHYPLADKKQIEEVFAMSEKKYQAGTDFTNPAEEETYQVQITRSTGWYKSVIGAVACLAVTVGAVSAVANMKRVPPEPDFSVAESIETETISETYPETKISETSRKYSETTVKSVQNAEMPAETVMIAISETKSTTFTAVTGTKKTSGSAVTTVQTKKNQNSVTVKTETVTPSVSEMIVHKNTSQPETPTEEIQQETQPETLEIRPLQTFINGCYLDYEVLTNQFSGFRIVFVKNPHNGKSSYSLYPENIPQEIETCPERYIPSWLPDGYALNDASFYDDVNEPDPTRIRFYVNDNQKAIVFKEYNTLARNLYPLTERDSVQEILDDFQSVCINGNYGYLRTEFNVNQSAMSFYTGTDYLPEQVTVLEWVDGNYEFQLYGEDVSAEELIRMAESVQERSGFSLEPAQTDENGLPVLSGFDVKYIDPPYYNTYYDITPVNFYDMYTTGFPTEETRYNLDYIPENIILTGEERQTIQRMGEQSVSYLCNFRSEDELLKFSICQSIGTSTGNFSFFNGSEEESAKERALERNVSYYTATVAGHDAFVKINVNHEICELGWCQDGYMFFISPEYGMSGVRKGIPIFYAEELLRMAESVTVIS